jgi:predicted HTH domain antitoxin
MQLLGDNSENILEISEADLKLEIAILLFQKDKISSGKAAEFAGIPVLEFWKELSTRNIDLIRGSTYIDTCGNLTL